MKKIILVIIVTIITILSSCNNKQKNNPPPPVNIISVDEMKKTIKDILLAEASINEKEILHGNVKYYTCHYYNYIFRKHNINKEQYWNSYIYYAKNSAQMEQILSDVIEELSQEQNKTGNIHN